jgi:hypothetical protein
MEEIMTRFIAVPLVCLLLLVSTSCAAIFNGTSETIHLRSDQQQTRFFANDRDLGTGSSAIATIPKNQLKRTVLRATKEGCEDAVGPVATGFDAVTLLGLLLDLGIVSIVVVDWAATGAITKASQHSYVLTPTCQSAAPSALGSASPAEDHLRRLMEHSAEAW